MTDQKKENRNRHHVSWVFILRLLEALGPEKGREVLAKTADELRAKGLWDTMLDDVVDEISTAYVCSVGLKDYDPHIEGTVYDFNLATARDYFISRVQAGIKPREAEDLINFMKTEGYLPQAAEVPTGIDEDTGNVRLLNPIEMLGVLQTLGKDEWGATPNCDCPRCQQVREENQKPENQPN